MQNLEYHVVYINLNRRTDRKDEIEQVLDSLQIPIERITRFPAIEHSEGWIGCTQSHYAVLEMAKREGWSAVLILEDDFMLSVSPREFHETISEAWKIPHDVLFVGCNILESEEIPGFSKIGRAFCTQASHGYIVHSHFYDRLMQNYKEAVEGGLQTGQHWIYTIDQYWKKIQKDTTTMWLYCNPHLGIQRPGFSDLAGKFMNYNE